MIAKSRRYIKTEYYDGRMEVFDPLIVWTLQDGIYEIGFRGNYEIGLLIGYHIGNFSRMKTKFIDFGKFTLYLHCGETKPHNPHTGEIFE